MGLGSLEPSPPLSQLSLPLLLAPGVVRYVRSSSLPTEAFPAFLRGLVPSSRLSPTVAGGGMPGGGMPSQSLPAVDEAPLHSAPQHQQQQQFRNSNSNSSAATAQRRQQLSISPASQINSESPSGRANQPAAADGLVPPTRPSDSASELRSSELAVALPPALATAPVRKIRFSE
jgi:hypothetical protein